MRRLFVGMVVVVATALAPMWASAGNQEVAETIAANLRQSGQLHGYKIGVKFQDGTAWLRGQVASHEQMNTALRLVFQTPGVTRVVNNLTIVGDGATATAVSNQPSAGPSPAAMPPAPSYASSARGLQQAAGAMAPEQFSRQRMTGTQMHAVGGQPDTMAASFSPAQPATVKAATLEAAEAQPSVPPTGQPHLAPPKSATPTPAQPIPIAFTQQNGQAAEGAVSQPAGTPLPVGQPGTPIPQYVTPPGPAMAPPRYDQPYMPNYAWPAYAAYPNYAALTYPKQYSPTAWPYIGPFYPYPQVPLGWRKVVLQWHDGWWHLDFDDGSAKGFFSGLFRPCSK